MNTTLRYAVLVVVVLIALHSILSFTHEDYGRATSISNIKDKVLGPSKTIEHVPEDYYDKPVEKPDMLLTRKANATLLMLARNSDIDNAIRSVRRLEDRFNRKYKYPWTFLNEVPFSDDFKKRISVLTDAPIEWGLIPKDHWYQPDWIDESKAAAERKKMEDENVIYGGSVSYRNMCRYNSGFFFRHELVQKYRWYWRVEPDVHFRCDIDFDPFLFMQDNNKTYGFTITMYEYERTIQTMWSTVKSFMKENPQYIAQGNSMDFMSDNGGAGYNLCHFWSNFEIADMDFWRGEAYMAFFEYLDKTGNFYYERWGDAPVHSIAAGLFLKKSQIHFFDEIGYEHNPYTHCPMSEEAWKKGKCDCQISKSFDNDGYSCMRKWHDSVARG